MTDVAEPPPAVTVGPYRFTIIHDDAEIDRLSVERNENLLGQLRMREGRIYLRRTCDHDVKAETLLHEILHGCLSAGGEPLLGDAELEERVVRSLSPVLLDTLRRNAALVWWLRGDGLDDDGLGHGLDAPEAADLVEVDVGGYKQRVERFLVDHPLPRPTSFVEMGHLIPPARSCGEEPVHDPHQWRDDRPWRCPGDGSAPYEAEEALEAARGVVSTDLRGVTGDLEVPLEEFTGGDLPTTPPGFHQAFAGVRIEKDQL